MTVSSEALIEVLERERRLYEALRAMAREQRRALYEGRPADLAESLAKEEAQVFRARENTEQRLALENAQAAPAADRAETLKSLRLFALENRQNLQAARSRLDEIHLSLAALNASEERPSYPGTAVPAGSGPSILDRKA